MTDDDDDRLDRALRTLTAARLVALFRVTPFARVFAIEHAADKFMPGDDTRRYGDTAVTFVYAP